MRLQLLEGGGIINVVESISVGRFIHLKQAKAQATSTSRRFAGPLCPRSRSWAGDNMILPEPTGVCALLTLLQHRMSSQETEM